MTARSCPAASLMNLRAVARILGIVLLLLAGFLLLPALVALLIEDPERPDDPLPFLGSALISAVLGALSCSTASCPAGVCAALDLLRETH